MSVHGREHSFRMKLGGTAEVYNTPVLSIELIGRDFFYDKPGGNFKDVGLSWQKIPVPKTKFVRQLHAKSCFQALQTPGRKKKERKQNGQNDTLQNLS